MKSITKRRLKPRSIGRNTLNRRHKRRHSNRRWGAGQNGSREKRMIGGAFDKYKGGVDLSNMFKMGRKNGWKCECTTTPQDPSSKSAPDTAIDVKPPMGQPRRPNAHTSFAAVTAPESSSWFKRRVAQSDIKDATLKGKYLINDDFDSVIIDGALTIIIHTKRNADALPKFFQDGQFITKVNDISVVNLQKGDFYKLLEDGQFYDKPVVLTVARGSAGGSGDKQIKVRVILKRDIPREGSVGGGKKTTYRRKKHVTQRKINTKRMKVMVGGTTIKEVTCTCTKEEKAPRRNQISPTSPTPLREEV